MSRMFTVQFEGVEYPLFFSILAMEKIYDKFGGMEQMMTEVVSETNPARQFAKVLDILTFENIAAVRYLESKGQNGALLDKDALLASLNPFEVNAVEYWTKALECINGGQERTVETETDLKNAEAAPEETL